MQGSKAGLEGLPEALCGQKGQDLDGLKEGQIQLTYLD